MQHTGITSGCATCHDTGKSFTGVTVKTKPVNHLPTGAIACESCHAPGNFTTFARNQDESHTGWGDDMHELPRDRHEEHVVRSDRRRSRFAQSPCGS